MAGPSKEFWEERFAAGETPWDRAGPSPQLARWISRGIIEPGQTVIVPGCGTGWEVVELAAAGFDTVALDYTAAAVEKTRERLKLAELSARVEQADVLEWTPPKPVDLVYEQTCLCALHPDRWREYADQLAAWVKPGGRLLALFMQSRSAHADEGIIEGPPYHCDITAMRALFPAPYWVWPSPPYEQVDHPMSITELAVEIGRSYQALGGSS